MNMRVREVAWMFAECLAMIAKHDEQRIVVEASLTQAVDQRAECHVALVQCVHVSPEVLIGF